MKVVFYPEMGIDVVAPLMAVPKTNKIYTLGPIPYKKFSGQGSLDKTMKYISKLMEYGDTRFDIQNDEKEIVEFFADVGQTIKSYNFKTKKMWLSQYKTCDATSVSVYYYYDARVDDAKLPFTEKIDYLIHKDYQFTDTLRKNVKTLLKPDTQLVATAANLKNYWGVADEILDDLEVIDIYDINRDCDDDLYAVNLNEYI